VGQSCKIAYPSVSLKIPKIEKKNLLKIPKFSNLKKFLKISKKKIEKILKIQKFSNLKKFRNLEILNFKKSHNRKSQNRKDISGIRHFTTQLWDTVPITPSNFSASDQSIFIIFAWA